MSADAETIDLHPVDGAALSAYRVAAGSPRGGVVLLQEIFGVNAHIRSVANAYASLGYGVLAPALFDRIRTGVELNYDAAGIEEGKALRSKVSDDMALLDIAAAVAEAGPFGKVAVVGYCWGGRLAWLAAARTQGLSAAVAYYPGGIGALAGEQPKVPVLLHFGQEDVSIPPAEVDGLRDRHPDAPVHLYPAGHGFSCDARPSFHAESHALALDRTADFLRTHLS